MAFSRQEKLGSSPKQRAKSVTNASTFTKKPVIAKRASSTAATGEIISSAGAISGDNPWGVHLRKAKPAPTKDAPPESDSNSFIRRRRSTLRHTPKVAKNPPKKTSSKKFKLNATPFSLNKAPLFGVVLRSVPPPKNNKTKTAEKKEEEENFLDLQFKGTSRTANTSGTEQSSKGTTKSSLAATPKREPEEPEPELGTPFGVRLKPVRRAYNRPKRCGSAFQIDLKPPSKVKTITGKYIPESKSFLEIRLKPVKRSASLKNDEKREFVELQLRHVVAPVDGGPKRAVTQASFRIPLLKNVNLNEIREKRRSLLAEKKAHDPLAEVLQLQIQNLKHTPTNLKKRIPDPIDGPGEGQTIQINLRHVDPATKEVHDLAESIRLHLKDPEYETLVESSPTSPKKRSSAAVPPSMQVSLNHKDEHHQKKHEAAPKASKVHLKAPVHVVHEEEWGEEEIHEGDDDDTEVEEYEEEELSDYDEHTVGDEEDDSSTTEYFDYEEVLEDGKKPKKPHQLTDAEKPKGDKTYFEYEEIIEIEEIEDAKKAKRAGRHNLSGSLPDLQFDEYVIPDDVRYEYDIEEQELEKEAAKKKKAAAKANKGNKGKKKKGDEYEEEEVLEDEYDEHVLEDEYEEHEIEDEEYEEHVLDDDESEYEEYEVGDDDAARKKKKRRKKKKPVKGQEKAPETTPEKASSKIGKAEPESEKPVPTTITTTKSSMDQTPPPANSRRARAPTNRQPPRRTRSRSLTEIDRMRKRRDDYVAKKKQQQEQEEAPKDLTNQKRRDLLMWYNRMKCPQKAEMKRRVAKLPPDCDITPEDVELLPWLCKGRFLDLKVMNNFFMADWQGTDEPK